MIDDSFCFLVSILHGHCTFCVGSNTRLSWHLIYDIALVRSVYAPMFAGQMDNENLVDTLLSKYIHTRTGPQTLLG